MRDDHGRLEISLTQVIGSALAAVSAAFAASWLGVAGTLLGAAAVSVIATVGTSVYSHSLRRTRARLRTVVLPMHVTPAAHAPTAAAETQQLADAEMPDERPAPAGPARWGVVGAVAASVFLLAMAGVTAIELTTGKSLPALVAGKDDQRSTTIGQVIEGNARSKQSTPKPTPSTTPTSTTTPSATPSPTPSESATPTETPSTEATPTPAGGDSTTPAQAPATVAPGTSDPPTSAPSDVAAADSGAQAAPAG
jgi:hypothetical protein